MNTAERLINAILDREGGTYTDLTNDPGGPTKWGITLATLTKWRRTQCSALDVMTLPRNEAFDIYFHRYYLDPGYAQIAQLSPAIADELTDTAVNCGAPVASSFLQRVLNAFNKQGTLYPDLSIDGDVGPGTLAALTAYLAKRKAEDGERVMVSALNCLQGERYIELAEKSAKFEDYTYGWIRNRVMEPA